MTYWLAIAASLFLFAGADVPLAEHLQPPSGQADPFPTLDEVPLFAEAVPSHFDGQKADSQTPPGITSEEESKLNLIRYVSGEFAKAKRDLPAGKQGFLLKAGEPLNEQLLDSAVATHGAAIHMGDKVQITGLAFRGHTIQVDLNGGGRGKHHWLQHIQIGFGGPMTMPQTTVTPQEQGPPGLQPGTGTTIFLEFQKSIPELTPAQLKQLLSPFLNFADERSAAVQWIDTLPPAMKKAIQERRPAVGMDREMVVAAIGKPDHKVRDWDAQGNETEDWIYGTPPDKTIFVRFKGDHVTAIEQFPK